MIKINLLGDDTAVDHSGKLIVAGYVLSLVMFCAIFYFMGQSVGADVARLTHETDLLTKQLNKLKETTKEVHELENKRQELNDKLAVIAKLKRNKIGPVRVMDDLNLAIPERAWVSDMKESAGVLRLVGFALDNQTIAVFMKDLEASDYFDAVELVETKQADREGVKIKAFTLDTKVNYAGKIKVEPPKPGSTTG